MIPSEIRKTWKSLLIPFSIGIILFVFSLIRILRFPNEIQFLAIFIGIFSLLLMGFTFQKIYAFRKYLKKKDQEGET